MSATMIYVNKYVQLHGTRVYRTTYVGNCSTRENEVREK